MRINVNMKFLTKGVIFALLIIVGPVIGVFMRLGEANGYSIWGVVAVINVLAFLAVYYLISREFLPDEANNEGKGKEDTKKLE